MPGRAEVDDDQFYLPGEEPPDPPGEDWPEPETFEGR